MIAVYTSIVGLRGSLLPDQNTSGAEFVAFVDHPWKVPAWRQEAACDRFHSPQRNALSPKLAPHLFLIADYSIWIESNVILQHPAETLIENWLIDADVAVLRHEKRNCIYEEAVAIARNGAAHPLLLAEQMAGYRRAGIRESSGLPTTFIVVRRHSARVSAFNAFWWSEYIRFSAHDQLSMLFAARETGVKVRLVEQNEATRSAIKVNPRPGFVEVSRSSSRQS